MRKKTYVDAAIASPHERYVPFGRRLEYGISGRSSAAKISRLTTNATTRPESFLCDS
jgi:hypothetical protein